MEEKDKQCICSSYSSCKMCAKLYSYLAQNDVNFQLRSLCTVLHCEVYAATRIYVHNMTEFECVAYNNILLFCSIYVLLVCCINVHLHYFIHVHTYFIHITNFSCVPACLPMAGEIMT